ncbi:MAG: hypothetical protein ABIA59_06430, partial [Candidatus Latescibacterota bacterium]
MRGPKFYYDERGSNTMLIHALLICLIVILFCSPALAEGGPFGIGIIVGEPTGISGKLYVSKSNAIDGAVAWSLKDNNDLHLHGDYLYHNYTLIIPETGKLPVYFGIGGRIKMHEKHDDEIGIRFPVGLDYIFASAPFDIFIEVVPIMNL